MKVYGPYRRREGRLDVHPDGTTPEGTHHLMGYYFTIADDDGEIFDVAGPFDDEHDVEQAMRRALTI